MEDSADEATTLVRYLQAAREAVLWKLEGLSEYDARRPLTPTGSNLLGLVKHLASVELGYFCSAFGRPLPRPLPWHDDDADPNQDMFATAEEAREDVVGLYRLAWQEAATTLETLGLDGEGRVPWWPEERAAVTVRTILVHLVAETNRHAGHADILRESLDGAAGLRRDGGNLPDEGYDWAAHVAAVESAARAASHPPA